MRERGEGEVRCDGGISGEGERRGEAERGEGEGRDKWRR